MWIGLCIGNRFLRSKRYFHLGPSLVILSSGFLIREFEVNDKILELRYHNTIVRRVTDMHVLEGRDYEECLEVAVIALCEQNRRLVDEISKRPSPLLTRSNY